MNSLLPFAAVACLVSSSLHSQAQVTPRVVLEVGDTLAGVFAEDPNNPGMEDPSTQAQVTAIQNLFVNDRGEWRAEVLANAPSNRDEITLLDGALDQREGTPLTTAPNRVVRDFFPWEGDLDGNTLQLMRVQNGTPRRELYWNGLPVLLEPTSLPVGLGQSVVVSLVRSFRLNRHGEVLLSAQISEGSLVNVQAIVGLRLDGNGAILETRVVGRKGDKLPGPDRIVDGFPGVAGARGLALNAVGDYLWLPTLESGAQALVRNRAEILATTNDAIPNPNDPLGAPGFLIELGGVVALNDLGDATYVYTVNGAEERDGMLVVNGVSFLRQGEPLASLGSALPDPNGVNTPVFLTNSGDLFWGAQLGGALPTEDRAYLRNREVIVREGDVIDGRTVEALPGHARSFYASQDGRYWVGEARLEGSVEVLLFADYGLAVPVPGTGVNVPTLALASPSFLLGGFATLSFDGAAAVGQVPALLLSDSVNDPGLLTPFGELLVGPFQVPFFGPPWNGAPVDLGFPLPADPTLAGATRYVQGAFFGPGPATPPTLTNGLRLTLGQP